MSLDARRRQKKTEKRAKKQRERKVAIARTTSSIPQQFALAAKAPVLHSFFTGDLASGITSALISRQLPGGRIAYAVFLVDIYCLGVKDVFLNVLERGEYDQMLSSNAFQEHGRREIAPETFRAFVEGAVAYAESIGFTPAREYVQAKLLFGDLDPTKIREQFTYGRDGKPFYIAGPHDSAEKSMRIVERLRESCGEGNFDFLLSVSGGGISFVGELDEDAESEDWDDDEEDSVGLDDEPPRHGLFLRVATALSRI